jgi:hypothetical protein
VAVSGPKRCLPLVTCFDPQAVICVFKVDLAKARSSSYPVYDLRD